MFGYVIPCKPQLKICEYELYKAVYCGLCKQLGRLYGPLARLTLSYDFAFLALLELSLSDSPADFSQKRCLLNPLKKMFCCGDCHAMEFSSGVAMILFYYKVLDNLSDETFGKRMLWRLCMPFAKHAYQQAADQYAAAAQIVYEAISRQSALESERCDSVDAAAEPSALALSGICGMLAQDSRQKRVLERFGYLLGRYVYLCDALDDLEKDARQNRYNPFLLQEKLPNPTPEQFEAIRTNAKGSLFLTIGELEKTYELLELTHYKPILDNIIQLGLRNTVERIFLPKETNH